MLVSRASEAHKRGRKEDSFYLVSSTQLFIIAIITITNPQNIVDDDASCVIVDDVAPCASLIHLAMWLWIRFLASTKLALSFADGAYLKMSQYLKKNYCSFILFMTTTPGMSGGEFNKQNFKKIGKTEKFQYKKIVVDFQESMAKKRNWRFFGGYETSFSGRDAVEYLLLNLGRFVSNEVQVQRLVVFSLSFKVQKSSFLESL